MQSFRSIIGSVDFTTDSTAAIRESARISRWNRASAHAVHVIDTPAAMEPAQALSPFQNVIQEGLIADARRARTAYAPDVAGPGSIPLDVQTQNCIAGILDAACEHDADLVVLGARGRNSIRELLLGSTAEKASRDTTCTVMAVKREGFTHPFATGERQPQAQLRATF
jgi:nucleotide-binding universal stress UspA family protein